MTYMFSFVTFASFLARLSNLSLWKQVITAWDRRNTQFEATHKRQRDKNVTMNNVKFPRTEADTSKRDDNLTISHLWKDNLFYFIDLSTDISITILLLLTNGDKYSSHLTGAYNDSLALLADKTE